MLDETLENTGNSNPQNNAAEIKNEGQQGEEIKTETKQETQEEIQKETQTDEVTVPETYDFKAVDLPDGMELDTELTAEFSDIAKQVGLSQENADKFMGLGVKLSSKIQEKFQSAMKEYQENQISAYQTMLNTDPEIGGANLEKTLLEANEAYDAFVSEEAAKLLSDTGLNKHPAIVKVFRDIGRQIKNDSVYSGGKSKSQRTADDWFPDMKKD